MYSKQLIKDEAALTASTDDIVIVQPKFLDMLTLSIKLEPDSANNITTSAALGLLNPVKVKLNGVDIVNIKGVDLYALNALMLGYYPLSFESGATTDNNTRIMGMKIPLSIQQGSGELAFKIDRSAVTNADTETYSLAAVFTDEVLAAQRLNYTTLSYTPASTGTYLKAADIIVPGRLSGLLCFSTTIPSASSDTTSLDYIKIRVDGETVYEGSWLEMREGVSAGSYNPTSTEEGIVDNYAYLDFFKDPFPENARLEIFIKAGDTNAIRLIPISQVG